MAIASKLARGLTRESDVPVTEMLNVSSSSRASLAPTDEVFAFEGVLGQ
jgi:hypothetical protein